MELFNKANIDQLNLIRKRLKEEFGEAPSLSDPKLLENILDRWVQSKDAITKSQIRKLMELIGDPWQSRYMKLVKKHAR